VLAGAQADPGGAAGGGEDNGGAQPAVSR